jgi:hypothetical protein
MSALRSGTLSVQTKQRLVEKPGWLERSGGREVPFFTRPQLQICPIASLKHSSQIGVSQPWSREAAESALAGGRLRRIFWFALACAFLAVTALAHAQQLDLAVGGNTLWSPKKTTASVGFLPPPERGGVYPSFSATYISANHFGINVEGAFRYRYALYDYFQTYRPVLYDVNAVWATRLANKTRGDFMAGVGGQTLVFYNQTYSCVFPEGGCRTHLNSTHFLTHAGVGIRYSVWRGVFVRPEAHWYYIPNNFQFHSNNVFRVGASVGWTFGERESKAKPKVK